MNRMIPCPNCKTSIRADVIKCPLCGNVVLEDSGMIRISAGELEGPGIKKLQEKQQDLVIKDGRILENAAEVVISGGSEKGVSPENVSHKILREQAATSEVGGIVNYQPSSAAQPASPAALRRPSGIPQKPRKGAVVPRPKKDQPSVQKKAHYPLRYYVMMYSVWGIGAILLVLLVVFTILHVKDPQTSTSSPQRGAQSVWDDAQHYHGLALSYYEEALKNTKDRKKNVLQAKQYSQKAMELGKEAWKIQIQHLMSKNKMTESEANEFAKSRYDVLEKMEEWEQEYKRYDSRTKWDGEK